MYSYGTSSSSGGAKQAVLSS